ncbi:FG-GAP-like repeat-containing protein [Stieleria sp. ICT_E10.1]|uniref:FG-GAP-like repeat-containing protein n=1 Tax=Stieleria sedimenti TaxID=2976331 RepID=UPI00217F4735|nr:FG-GAP-like repeat-containing protein [Stieleria sedimenti]MCS7468168.1 FG-GAP-like repeat-containing protein [Stieleria sedimenti]
MPLFSKSADRAAGPFAAARRLARPRNVASRHRIRRKLQTETLEKRQLLAAEIEPNDVPASATALPRGDVLEGTISSTRDVDFFRVDLNRGDRFSINTFNINAPRFSPTLPPGLEILDSSGRTLVTSDDGDTARLVAPATGQYFIRVGSENVFGTFVGPYGMQSSYTGAPANFESEPNDTLAVADGLNGLLGEKVIGQLADASEQDVYSLNASAGQTLVVSFAGLQTTSPAVEVLDSLGNVIGENQSGTGIVLQIQDDQQVFVALSGANSSGAVSGDYAMVVDLVDDAQAFPDLGDSFETAGQLDTTSYRGNFVGILDGPSDRDFFQFEIDDIEFLRFDLQLSGSERIVESGKEMRLYNAFGQELIYSPNGRISTEVDDALVPGSYFLEVLADSPIGTGAYAVEYVTITDFSLQRDNAVHFMDFDSTDPYLGFDRVAPYAVPDAIDYYLGTFDSRYGVYDAEATRDKPAAGKERVASGIGNFGDIGAGGFGGGYRGVRSSNGNTVNSALETSATVLRRLTTTTVNHEFGHATGLPHARDVQAFMSYVGTTEYLPVGGTYAFQGTDSRRPGNQVYDVRDYLDFILQPGSQVYVSEQTESTGQVSLDSYLREMSIDYSPTAVHDVGDRPTDVVAGDFNNDGRDDIVMSSDTDDSLQIFIAAADGTLGAPLTIAAGGNLGWWTDVLEVGDFDNDGDDDIAMIVNGAQRVSVLISNGDGTFAPAFNYPLFGNPNGLHVSDLNDDGILDFAVTVRNDNSIRVYTGDGDGRFSFLEQLSAGTAPHGVSSGDFDGDGNQDLVTTNFTSDDLTLWYGNGAGGFNRPIVFATGDGPESVTSDDFNNDGRDDLAVVYREDRAVRVFLSDASGLPVQDAFHDTRITTHFISSDDVDQDGFEDLIVGGFGNTLKIQLGSPDGTFTRPISIQTGDGEAVGAVADLDGDGDNELAITNYWEGTLSVVDEPAEATKNDRVVVFAMIDGDRDVDRYTVDVVAGQRFTFDIDSAEFQYPLDGVMSILASDGSLIATSDDATDGNSGIKSVDPFLDWTFASDDTITVRIEGKLSSAGNYRLKVTPGRAIDSVGPTVIAMHPDNGDVVNSTRQITFYFDGVLDETTLTQENIVVTDSSAGVIAGTAVANPLDSTVVWTADSPLTPGDYTIRLVSGSGGITDLAGNPLNGLVQADYSFPDRSGSATSPAEDFVARLTISGTDTTPARVQSVSYIRDPYNASRFVVRMNDQLSMPSVHSATYTLRGTGPDGVFDSADDTWTELDATYEAINSTFNSTLNLYSRGVVDSGRYRIEADLVDVAGHVVRLFESVTVSGSVAEANLFTDAALSNPGLTGSYVNTSLRTVDEIDWRVTQTISGTRVDPKVSFLRSEFGVRSTVGITGGVDDDNWDNFSVQWDGYVVVPEDGVQLLTRSDDSSRFWIDLDRSGSFDSGELFDNGWGSNQPLLSGELTPGLIAGTYQIRIQYQETAGGNEMHFDWIRPGRRVDVGGFIHGPSVTDVSITPGTHVFDDSIQSLDVTFSGNLDLGTLTADNFTLLQSDDATFFDGTDVVVPDADGLIGWDPSRNVATLEFGQSLRAGFYLLEVNGEAGGITNSTGDLLDGEFLSNAISGSDSLFLWDKKPSGNGIAGGDFRAAFSVSRPLLDIEIDPGSISENGGQAIATIIRRNADLSTPIVVTLSVSDSTELRLGSSFVTIPAGVDSVAVPVFGVDDDLLDGPQFVGVTATASNFQSDVAFVEVTDYETFGLRLSSRTVFENSASVTLTLTRLDARQAAVVDLTASRSDQLLLSSNRITIPAGQTQATVTLTGRDNQILDGTQSVTITTFSVGMIDATTTLDVLDYEPLTLIIDEDSIRENGGMATARLTRTDTSQPLTATIGTAPAGLLSVPATITFADGAATSDPFVITANDNSTLDAIRVGTVTASGPGYITATDTVNVTDYEELTLVTASNFIAENGGTIEMQVRRSDPRGNTVATLTSTSPGRLAVPGAVQFDDGSHLSRPFFAAAIDNDQLEGDQIVSVVASATGYQLSRTELTVTDHEQLTLTRLGDPLTESSGTATYRVTRPAPEGEAVVVISGGAFDSLRLPASVRFGATQTEVFFTAEVVDNPTVAGDQSVDVSVASAGYIADTLTETIQDNDTPELHLLIDSTHLVEGNRRSVARLTRNTLQGMTVSIAPSVADTLQLPSSVSFLPGRPTVAFEITAMDNQVVDGTRQIDLTFAGAGHPDEVVTISVLDDEVAGFDFLTSNLQVTEGAAPGVTSLALSVQPISDVTIAIASSDPSQLDVSPTELTFTPANWSIPQTLEATAIDDFTSEENTQVTLTATVTSGVAFDELAPQTLTADVIDDDVASIWLEETDGSTIVNEFGLDDPFSLALGTRPLSPVQLSIDGAAVPEAVFTPSVLTFTPDNWDQPQVVVVSTPLDFVADRNLIGSVYVNVDQDQSDPVYAEASRRIIGVVHIDSILSDLRIRQQGDRIVLIDEISGETLRSTAVGDPGGATLETGDRSESIFVEPLPDQTQLSIRSGNGDDQIALSAMTGGEVDGGDGYDTVTLVAGGLLPPELSGGVVLRNIERLDLTDAASQALDLDAPAVIAMTDANNSLHVNLGAEDQLTLANGWQFETPINVAGYATHRLVKDDATLHVSSGSVWQNPFNRFDVNRNGEVSLIDALITINRLAVDSQNELPLLPEMSSYQFYDVNGDGLATSRDALAIINSLATQVGSEGESPRIGTLPAGSDAASMAEPTGAETSNSMSLLTADRIKPSELSPADPAPWANWDPDRVDQAIDALTDAIGEEDDDESDSAEVDWIELWLTSIG